MGQVDYAGCAQVGNNRKLKYKVRNDDIKIEMKYLSKQ